MMSDVELMECPLLPERPSDGHKGTFGRVLLVGGSTGMSGSISLAAVAALRSGSGLVTAAVPRSIQAIVAAFEASCMTIGLACDSDGCLHEQGLPQLMDAVTGRDAVGIGPGLGTSKVAELLVHRLLSQSDVPLVLDADALNVIAAAGLLEKSDRVAQCVLTPHPGEFARLTDLTPEQIDEDRQAVAMEFAKRLNVVLVLKGQHTLVTDGIRLYCNTTGNSGMATGGSGDVLTGMITSLLGQGMTGLEAAALAVHVHGLAGDLAAAELSQRSMIASDLLRYLPPAWLQLERGTSGSPQDAR
jgi:ADP-dependent NAD(P)H-hydrate dehydratase